MRMYVVIATTLIGITTPTLAAEYYVVKDPTTEKCKATGKKPDGQTRVMVGTATYPTKDEAKAAMKAMPECEKEDASPAQAR